MADVPTGFLDAYSRIQGSADLTGNPTSVPSDFLSAYSAINSGAIPTANLTQPLPDSPPTLVGDKQPDRGKIYSGGVIRDIFDTMSAMQYAAAGAAHGLVTGQNPLSSAIEGVKNRASWEDVLGDLGMPEGLTRSIAGLAGDIVLDPAWILTPAKAFNALKQIDAFRAGTTAAKDAFEASKLGKFLGENFVYAYKLPEGVKDAWHGLLEKINPYRQEIANITKQYRALGEDASKYVVDYLNTTDKGLRETILKAADAAGIDAEKLANLGERSQFIREQILKGFADEKVLGAKKLKLAKQITPYRNYSTVEDIQNHIADLERVGDPISKSRATALNDWLVNDAAKFTRKTAGLGPAEVEAALKDSLGELSDAGYTVAKSALIGAQTHAEAEFLNKVVEDFGSARAVNPTDFKIPDIARYGALGGKYVPREVGLFITQQIRNPTAFEQAIRGPLNLWKMFKVTASPAAQFRNMAANLGLINIAGVPAIKIPGLYEKAWKLLRGETEIFGNPQLDEQAVKLANEIKGNLESSFVTQELNRSLRYLGASGGNFFQSLRNMGQIGLDKASTLYRNAEVWGKTAAGLHAIQQGMDYEKAALFGEKALFNYAEVPRAVDFLRRNGIVPFASFSYFASNATARAAWANPAVLTKYSKIMDAVEGQNPQAQAQRAAASDWMKQFGQVFTPIKDKFGRNLVFDASYLIPFQDISAAAEGGIGRRILGLTPVPTMLQDLLRNRSSFTGENIAPPVDLTGPASAMKEIAVKNYIDYIYKFMLPTWAPSLLPGYPDRMKVTAGGPMWKNLSDAITARPDVFGKVNGKPVQDWKAAVMGEVFGLKTRPFDLTQNQKQQAYEYKDNIDLVTKQMRKVAMDQTLTTDQKGQLIDQLKTDLINIHRAWRASD